MSTLQYRLTERGSTRTLQIGDWLIATVKKPILNGREIEAAGERIEVPLPEMTFGNNALTLAYCPQAESSASAAARAARTTLDFRALDALEQVAAGEDWEDRIGGGVQVSVAEEWGKKRSQGNAQLSDAPISSKPVKPHDWTYSTVYPGGVQGSAQFQPDPEAAIPLTLLARQDPVKDQILFYDDVPLFEDELHDNGESIMNVRIRVMPHCFFILQRLFLRVDNVLFRIRDVRIYHSFGTDTIVREASGWEAKYSTVRSMLEAEDDLSPLTNANYMHQLISGLPDAQTPLPGAPGKPWPGLGKQTQTLRLDDAADGIRYAEQALAGITIK